VTASSEVTSDAGLVPNWDFPGFCTRSRRQTPYRRRKRVTFCRACEPGSAGYLWREASAEDVLNAIRAVHAREAVCPGALCSALSTILNAKHRGYRQPAPAIGVDATRAATRSVDCQRLHQQGNRESLLLVGANREEPPVPQQAQDRGRRAPEHCAEIPHGKPSAVIVRLTRTP
jgi:hypothetical protein